MSLDLYLKATQICPACNHKFSSSSAKTLWRRNITHNLIGMADAAGLYEAVWCPDEHGYTHARMVLDKLRDGISALRSDPEKFCAFNPKNGWGNYEVLLAFVEAFLAACEAHPDATIRASR